MSEFGSSGGTSRRDFAKIAFLGLAGGLAAAQARAQQSGSFTGTVGGVEGSAEDLAAAITKDTLAEAEKLYLLSYSDAERAQILSAGFDDILDALRTLRAVDLPNTLAPALIFDPRPAGFETPGPGRVAPRLRGPSPMGGEADIAYASILDQARWLRDRRISSRELTEIYLRRIAQHAPSLECFVTVTADLAREQADAADRELRAGRDRGPLHGLPFALKDLADVEGLPATWGAAPYKDRIATEDSTVYKRLRDAGAVLVGKATLGAIAYGDIWFGGRTRNPWNLEEGSSGSSAGSASATAAGLCSFSIGTETLGSIVSPSTRCGATGLRPTFGRISRAGAMALCWSLDKFGPICRYTEDTALVLEAVNGYDPADHSSIDAGFAYDGDRNLRSLRIGYAPAWFEDAHEVDAAALDALRGLGADLVEIEAPSEPADPLIATVLCESAAAFEELTLSDRDDEMVWQVDRAWPNSWRQARLYSAVDYVQVDRLRRRHMEEMDRVFRSVDVLFGPSFAGGMLTRTNYTGHPQLAIRAGFENVPTRNGPPEEGAPTHRVPRSVSFWAPLFAEGAALVAGRALEEALDVADERPPIG